MIERAVRFFWRIETTDNLAGDDEGMVRLHRNTGDVDALHRAIDTGLADLKEGETLDFTVEPLDES